MSTWLAAHWLTIVSLLLIIVGFVYVGYGFLKISFLQRLTQGIVYGLVFGLFGGVPTAIVLLFTLLFSIILLLIENVFIPGIFISALASIDQALLASLSLSLTGLLFGIGIGFITGIASIRIEEASVYLR